MTTKTNKSANTFPPQRGSAKRAVTKRSAAKVTRRDVGQISDDPVRAVKRPIVAAARADSAAHSIRESVKSIAKSKIKTKNNDKRRLHSKPESAFFRQALPKVEKRVPLMNETELLISGVSADPENQFVLIRQGKRKSVTPMSAWANGAGEASKTLVRDRIYVVLDFSAVRQAVAEMSKFPTHPVLTRSGWASSTQIGFALPDGTVQVHGNKAHPLKAFAEAPEMLGKAGTLKQWRKLVAEPIGDHEFASFFMMAMFAGPLLRLTDRSDNFGFEIASLPGRGKSVLQQLISSAAGPAIGRDGATYWRTCNATTNALETVMAEYNDLTLVLDEAGAAPNAGAAAKRLENLSSMAFRLGLGRVRQRFGEGLSPLSRLIYIISTNLPLRSLQSQRPSAEDEAIADRLMTVPLLPNREFNTFDFCPDGYTDAGAFASALKRAAGEHYGHALQEYLAFLVRERATRPRRLNRYMTNMMNAFIAECGIDPNNGSERRVAEAFGLVGIAGALARKAGVLPANYKAKKAALACYALHRDHGRALRSFDDELKALLRRPDVVDADEVDVAKMSPSKLATCQLFSRTNPTSGNRELLVRKDARDVIFRNWNGRRHGIEVQRRLVTERGRNTSERRLTRTDSGPFYAFLVTDLEG